MTFLDRAGGRTSWLSAAVLSALAGLVPALNAPMPDAAWVGLGGCVLAASCLRFGSVAGRLLCRDLPLALRFLIGFVLLAYALALPVKLAGVPILFPAALFVLLGPLLPKTADPVDREGFSLILTLLAAAGFAALWSLESTHRVGDFAVTGVFRLWLDFFSHAGIIAEFGDPRAIGRGSAILADMPENFYHFVSFALPALAVRLLDMTPLQSVTSIWLPVGIFATALGVMALGREVAGPAGGALAVLLLAACPDTAAYGLRQGFLSFHWMLETAPGSLYALPCACAAICLLVPWCRESDPRALLGSGLLLGAVFLLRAHVFIWLAGPWAATALISWRRLTLGLKLALLAAGVLAAGIGMLAMARTEIATRGFVSYLAQYIEFLHQSNAPTGYDGLYPGMVASLGRGGALVPGLALAWLAMGGAPLLTFLFGAVLAWRRRRLEALDLLPFGLLIWSGLFMLLAPTPFNQDTTEFRQRGFVLIVIILLVWNARWFVLLAPGWTRARGMALISCAVLPVTAIWITDWKAPRMAWGAPFVSASVSPDVIAAAAWLRKEAGRANVFTLSRMDENIVLFDEQMALVSLSGVPAWLARPGIHTLAGGASAAAMRLRLATLTDIAAAADKTTALAPLHSAKVDFYIVHDPAGPRWDTDRAAAAFRSGDLAIYCTATPCGTR